MIIVLASLNQLSSAYLRYLPFSREMSAEQKSLLLKRFLLWTLANLAIDTLLFADGVSFAAFKIAMFVGWIPYFVISMTVIRHRRAQHWFVFGMQGLWTFMLHSSAGMVVKIFYGAMTEELLTIQLAICFGLFVALLKVERKFFVLLLPSNKFFENRSLRWCISLLPVAIFVGTSIPIAEVTFLPTWREKFSRIILPIVFFVMYRSLSLATRRLEEKQRSEQKNFELRRQRDSLNEQNALMQASRREVQAMERKLADNYAEIEKLLVGGKIHEAMNFIGQQTQLLDSTAVKTFCRSPLINAALSLYSRRAETSGIKTSFKVDLPEKFSTDESELAVVISNLLENAIIASKKNTPEREISLTLRNNGGQNVLEITNRFDFPIPVGENGLPCTKRIGHGLGMASLEIFANKNDAFVDFSHEGGLVRFTIYWNDYL
ncbi:MAG: sensor histidine kinase [Selenomonadaceae bacterium]|nr:sensor histidine kinase [Selenomonadaceae bacterium]MBR4384765.1 sensor histidine kinase [Selenomonadaceae bacterium]